MPESATEQAHRAVFPQILGLDNEQTLIQALLYEDKTRKQQPYKN